jgi:MATE family multidrug resistance protein
VTIKKISHRDILQVAIPMILANISIPFSGMVDTAVVGHLDSAYYLGGVAIGAVIFSFLFWAFGFLRMSTTGLTAQAFGQQNTHLLETTLLKALITGLIISSIVLLSQSFISKIALHLLDASKDVSEQAKVYFDIRIWSTPAILLNYALLGWFIGKQSTRHALILVLTVTISNMLLDIALVSGMGMTVDGVALASVIAEYLGLVVGLYLLRKHAIGSQIFQHLKHSEIKFFDIEWLTLNSNIFIRTILLLFSFAFFTAQSSKAGDVILAANSVLLNFLTLIAFLLDGFANATELFSGKAAGKKDKTALKRALVLTGFWSLIIACLFSGIYWLFGKQIILIMTSIDEVVNMAEQHLIWLIIMPIVGVWAYLFDGLFIGTTRSKEMRNSMFIATFLFYLPVWYFLQPMGNDGLWLSLMIFISARGLIQSLYLSRILNFR